MKGLVFCEFLGMVEREFGYEIVDQIIEDSKLESNGVYTSVGTYSHQEIFALVEQLSKKTGVSVSKLFYTYGIYVFDIFKKSYQGLIVGCSDSFQFLSSVDNVIHVEVLKLYPEAELPSISIQSNSLNKLELVYSSKRRMSDFAEGLIQGCLNHFNDKASISRKYLTKDQTLVLFTIQRGV